MPSLLTDLRVALRSLVRRPTFTLAAIACFALGIGVNLSVANLADRLLIRPPAHVQDAETLFQARYSMELPGIGSVTASTFSYPTFLDLSESRVVEGIAAARRTRLPAGKGGAGEEVEPIDAVLVSASFFPVLGVQPAGGRFFTDQEVDGEAAVAVLAYRFARERFAEPASALGQTIHVAGREYTVVGVAPEGFRGVEIEPVDLWLPVTTLGSAEGGDWRENRRSKSLQLLVRLQEERGAPARAEVLTAIYRRTYAGTSPFDEKAELVLDSVRRVSGPGGERVTAIVGWLAGLSVLVLLIASTNVAGLLIAQALARRKDFALRVALGAGPGGALRQVLLEIVLLVALGGAAALWLLKWFQEAAFRLFAPEALPLDQVLDIRALGLAAGVMVVAVLLSIPAALVGFHRLALFSVLMDSNAVSRTRLRSLLVAGQVAFSVILLVGAGLFVRSLQRATSIDLGFEPEGLLVVTLDSGTAAGRDELPSEPDGSVRRASVGRRRSLGGGGALRCSGGRDGRSPRQEPTGRVSRWWPVPGCREPTLF